MLASNMFFLRAGLGYGLNEPSWLVTPVTIVSRRDNVSGGQRERIWVVTGDSGYTLVTRLRKIKSIMWNDATITGVSYDEFGNLTFTSSGAFTGAEITVTGN